VEFSDIAEFTYTMPAGDITLTANFQEDPGFTCGDNVTFTYRGQEVTYGTVLSDERCWLDRNLGAAQVPVPIQMLMAMATCSNGGSWMMGTSCATLKQPMR